MKKLTFILIFVFLMGTTLTACVTENNTPDAPLTSDDTNTEDSKNGISKEMAYEGIYNYCHSMYDWSMAEDNPDIMYVKLGEETESEYQVIFRSYTGSFVYFYVDKSNGVTRLIESVPSLNIEEETGTINLYDYLNADEN